MKKFVLMKLLCALVVTVTLVTVASAAGFTKTLTYADGTFSDVKSTSWYAKEVASAYELGFMNGKSEARFAPDGNVTVAEAITMASRVHAIYNGKEIAQTDGKWYDMYVDYAIDNGIISDGQYTNFDRNIMRYEMAVMFADAMPDDYFKAINDVKEIPDVAESEEYHDKILMLYNAGVVMGNTEYGDFLATNSIKRSETAAIINRVALPENRQQKTLKEYGDRDQAVYLIDNHSMLRTVRNKTMIASGWRYENTIDATRDDEDKSSNILTDMSETGYAAMHRDVTTVSRGTVKTEAKFNSDKAGYSVVFSDINGNNMFTLRSNEDGTYTAIGDTEQIVNYTFSKSYVSSYFELDLDARKVKIVIGAKEIGTYDMSKTATDISRLSFVTGIKETVSLTVTEVYMYVNYHVNDLFRIDNIGEKPYGWDVTGDVKVQISRSDLDSYSVNPVGTTKSVKTFEPVSDKFVFETFVKVPVSQAMNVSIKNGNQTAVSIDAKDGKFTTGTQHVRDYTNTIWQLIRIEGDTNKNTALIKINNKECLTVPLNADSIDTIEISSSGYGSCWFDDVELYNVYDYADYCPEPVPVTDDEWYVGMSICSLWREGTHYGWDCISPYDEATPVIGYYDEGLPEVADWEIKMLVEHGYDFQHFCWYIGNSNEGIKEPRLGDALNNGYMNAKYSDMQDFMIMWENANGGSVKDFNSFKSYVWDYWCDWYFSDDRYFTIDNKPVLTIYQFLNFIEQMGGEEEAKKAVEFMREDIKKLGYDGMIILFCNNGSSASNNQLMKNLGGDAFVCYNFGEDSYNADFQKSSMNTAFNNGHLSLLPSISVGFNDIGWTETRSPNATPEVYKEVLEWARDDYMPRIDEREDEDWKSRFVIGNTWNEYGEGHYIMPTNVCGFGYIDANRKVFSSASGTDDKAHFDVVPTDTQKARLGYLYPNRTQLIKRTYWLNNDSSVNYENLEVVKGWNFENRQDTLMWLPMMNTSTPVYSDNDKVLVGKSYNSDPAITLLKTDSNNLNADEIKYLKINMKYDEGIISNATIYFKTEGDKEYAQTRSASVSINGNGEYKDYYIDLSANKFWKGIVTDVRFDPSASEGNYYIKSLEFLKEKSNENVFVIDIDGKLIETDNEFVKKVGDEVFVAGNPTYGFYSLHNFYTEWNRYSGTLMLKTGTGHVFNFTVGSDKALVDGKEKKLAAAFDVIDGLPYIPLKFVYKNAEMNYNETKNGFKLEIRGEGIGDIINSRVENEYEFNIDGDTEGWNVSAASGAVTGGVYSMTATPTGGSTGYDPKIQISTALNTALYKTAEVRIKPFFDEPSQVTTPVTFYFATNNATNLSESKTAKVYFKDFTPDEDGFYTLIFDFSQNEEWEGTAITLRFDPTNSPGTYEIDYIRMIKDPDADIKMKAELEREEERVKLLYEVDDGKPFYIENADAEDTSIVPDSHKSYTPLKIVEDDLKKGNHAFELVPIATTKNWSYSMIPTRFKPGVTYKVEFDIRVTTDHNGDPVEAASLSWNLRYADVVNGTFKEMADHHESLGKFGTADGWQHVSFTHTIAMTSEIRDNDYFAIFANPLELSDGEYRNIGYMIDNIKVEVVG